jgi:hypothetical protein
MVGASFACIDAVNAATFQVDSDEGGRADLRDVTPGNGQCAADNGRCTLRAAIEESNSLAGPDRIELPAGRYVLSLGELRIEDSLILNGAGAATTIIDANDTSRVLVIAPKSPATGAPQPSPPTVSVANVTITGGRVAPLAAINGAGVVNSGGSSLALLSTIISNNEARQFGGGVTNSGFLRIFDTAIRGNTLPRGGGGQTSSGGGVFNFGDSSIEIVRSVITGNQATRGGGIRNAGGRLEILNTTISGNTAFARGGGIMNFGVANIGFSTITLNQANVGAGGEPTVGGGIFNEGTVNLGSTILAENMDNRSRSSPDFSPDCFSPSRFGMISFRNNVIGILNANCDVGDTIFGDLRFDQAGSAAAPLDPGLEALADNGGSTPTHGLADDSPAIDTARFVTSARFFDCPEVDQRDLVRPGDGSDECDVGAFEANAQPLEQEVAVDVRPRQCPNRVRADRSGNLPVAILGSDSFDVRDIDIGSVRLAGTPPKVSRSTFRDVAAPFEPFVGKGGARDCTRRGGDGLEDLLLRFSNRRVARALDPDSEIAVAPLTGELEDGTPIHGEDVIVIIDP